MKIVQVHLIIWMTLIRVDMILMIFVVTTTPEQTDMNCCLLTENLSKFLTDLCCFDKNISFFPFLEAPPKGLGMFIMSADIVSLDLVSRREAA